MSIDKDGIIRVAVDGAITYEGVLGEKNPLATLLGETWSSNRVILSLDKTQFIDSAAIGWMISTQKEFKSHGGKFIVHSIRPPVRNVLDLLKVGKVVSIAANEQAARALAKGE
ncbi:MAG TPA: STAS domain-containing protein [Tepidisphaeraceae bacterium]